MSPAPLRPRSPFALGRVLGPATVAVFLLGWLAAFYPYDDLLDRQGTPLGGDYVMFYLGGEIAADGAPDKLYDQAEHCRRMRRLFPDLDEGDLLPYRYPPFVAALFAPLARLPLAWSFAVFVAISLAAWLGTLWLLRQNWPEFFTSPAGQGFWWGALGWPVALETLAGGQASLLALCIATCGVALLRKGRPMSAGAVLALALYKPNVLALFLLGVILRYPRTLLGIIPVAAAMVLFGIATTGWETTWTYATLGRQLVGNTWQTPTPFWKVHGLASWLSGVAGGKLLTLGLGIALVTFAAIYVRRPEDNSPTKGRTSESANDIYLALLLGINALCNPYVPIYDLALLLLPLTMLLASIWSRGTPHEHRIPAAYELLAFAIFFGPHLSQSLSFTTHGQAFTLLLGAFVVCLASCQKAGASLILRVCRL